MKRLIQFFVDRSFVVNLITGFVILAGVVTLTSMRRDLIPPLEFQSITISAQVPGATPAEIEKYVTFPIEETLNGLPGVEKVSSTSQHGTARVSLHYEASYEKTKDAVELIRARLNSIRHTLPETLRSLNVERSQVTELFLFFLGLENFDQANEEHRRFFKKLKDELVAVPGIVSVGSDMRSRDVYVEFDPDKLRQYEISMSEARSVLHQVLRMTPIGQAKVKEDRYSVEIATNANSIEDLKNVPLSANYMGHSVQLMDVAQVHYKLAEKSSQVYINGVPGISVWINKDTTTDIIDLKTRVLKLVEDFQKSAPEGIKVVNLTDGPHFIQQQLKVLSANGAVGLVLVVLTLMLFLNWRTSLMTTLGLPLAYCGTLIVLFALGMSIDLLSIIGMILVVGILVDDAIIIAERYNELLEQGVPPREAAYSAAKELIVPVTGTILTTIVAFSPFLLIKSEIGEILKAVPVVIIVALILSWLESFFILPNHLAHFVKKPKKDGRRQKFFAWLKAGYVRLLRHCVRWRYVGLALFIALLVGAGYLGARHIRHDFNFRISSERLSVYAVLEKGSSYEESFEAVRPIHDWLRARPDSEVENVVTYIGSIWMDGKHHEGLRFIKMNAYINREAAYPEVLKKSLKSAIDQKLVELKKNGFEKLYAEVERENSKEEKGAMIAVRIRGAEDVRFNKIESFIKKKAEALASIAEYSPNPERYQKSWVFMPDFRSLAQYGLTPVSLSSQMRGIFTPHEVSETRLGGERIYVYTQLDRDKDLSFKDLSDFEVLTPNGASVPLGFLGQWQKERVLREITHYDGQRNLTMDFKVNEKDGNITTAKTELKRAMVEIKNHFPTYEIEVIDSDEQQAKNQAWALKVALVCILGVLFVIALILGSLTQPFLVGLPIPFALIGTVLALYLHDLPLGLMAIIGVVGTIGVAVNDSLVMVDQINRFGKRAGGMSREVLIDGASSRLRAIILTTLTTLGGVFPMAYAIGGESGFTQPLAFSMAWGLTFATLMTLFLLPPFLAIREDFLALGRKAFSRWMKIEKDGEDVVEAESDWQIPQKDWIDSPSVAHLVESDLRLNTASNEKETRI